MQSEEKHISVEGIIMGLGRNLVLGKLPEFHKTISSHVSTPGFSDMLCNIKYVKLSHYSMFIL